MDMTARTAAFFDVDDTLITMTSMFRFLAFDLAARNAPHDAFRAALDELGRLKRAGLQRSETNRVFYRNFAGRSVAKIAANGRSWFVSELATGKLFHPHVLAAFAEHTRRGDYTVLVSGSFGPCLTPIAEYIGADVVLCTQLEVNDGVYSGEVVTPMIGAEKCRAARSLAAELDLCLTDSYAYGDHPSDLPILEIVGHPVVVGNDAELARVADRRSWRRLTETQVDYETGFDLSTAASRHQAHLGGKPADGR
jgi:HAD superfamily hydrolase (TIGR01490 family)